MGTTCNDQNQNFSGFNIKIICFPYWRFLAQRQFDALLGAYYDSASRRNKAVLLPQPLQAAELIDSEFRPGMSNRQKNKAKRMAKLVAKQRSRDLDPNEKRYCHLQYSALTHH